MVLNQELTCQEKLAIKKAVSDAVNAFVPECIRLMEYLRSNYREVDITAYR